MTLATYFNPLTPRDTYRVRTATLTSEVAFCIFIQQIQVLNILNIVLNLLRATDQKHLESFEMWCWRSMEKISWTDHVRNEEVLLRVNEQRNILHEIIKRKANWIGHILR